MRTTDGTCPHAAQRLKDGYAFAGHNRASATAAVVKCHIAECLNCGERLYGLNFGDERTPNFIADPTLLSPVQWMRACFAPSAPEEDEDPFGHRHPQHDPGE